MLYSIAIDDEPTNPFSLSRYFAVNLDAIVFYGDFNYRDYAGFCYERERFGFVKLFIILGKRLHIEDCVYVFIEKIVFRMCEDGCAD